MGKRGQYGPRSPSGTRFAVEERDAGQSGHARDAVFQIAIRTVMAKEESGTAAAHNFRCNEPYGE